MTHPQASSMCVKHGDGGAQGGCTMGCTTSTVVAGAAAAAGSVRVCTQCAHTHGLAYAGPPVCAGTCLNRLLGGLLLPIDHFTPSWRHPMLLNALKNLGSGLSLTQHLCCLPLCVCVHFLQMERRGSGTSQEAHNGTHINRLTASGPDADSLPPARGLHSLAIMPSAALKKKEKEKACSADPRPYSEP